MPARGHAGAFAYVSWAWHRGGTSGLAMFAEDVKPISADDHVVEPPHVWTDRLPSKYRDVGPRVVEVFEGVERPVSVDGDGVVTGPRMAEHVWLCEDRRAPVRLQGSPRTRKFRTDGTDEDFHARSYNDMIPAAYEVNAR